MTREIWLSWTLNGLQFLLHTTFVYCQVLPDIITGMEITFPFNLLKIFVLISLTSFSLLESFYNFLMKDTTLQAEVLHYYSEIFFLQSWFVFKLRTYFPFTELLNIQLFLLMFLFLMVHSLIYLKLFDVMYNHTLIFLK